MAEKFTSYIVENDKAFLAGINRLQKATDDFSIPFNLIRNDFHRSNKIIFSLKGPGLYPDLAESTKIQKEKLLGTPYPILDRTGRLAASLLNPNDSEAVSEVGKQTLLLGTDVPYAIYHQSDEPRSKLPQRKVVFIDGGPAEKSKASKVAGRRERWLNIINSYILELINAGIIKE